MTPFHPDSHALAKRYLTPTIYNHLADLKTPAGFTLDAALASGTTHADSSIGIYAGDIHSYSVFKKIMIPIIRDYHHIEGEIHHPGKVAPDTLAKTRFSNPDPDNKYILSTRIRLARNLGDLPFPPHMSQKDRGEVMDRMEKIFDQFPRELSGHLYAMEGLDPEELNTRIGKKEAFPKGDRFQEAAGINRGFPEGRGLFKTPDNSAMVWINEEDHLRIISMVPGGNFTQVCEQMSKLLCILESQLNFAHDPNLGYLSSCPTNIGTAMRAGVHIRLPRLGGKMDQLRAIVAKHRLQIRGTGGEKTEVRDAIFDISNKHRLGLDEVSLIQGLHRGIIDLIQREKELG